MLSSVLVCKTLKIFLKKSNNVIEKNWVLAIASENNI